MNIKNILIIKRYNLCMLLIIMMLNKYKIRYLYQEAHIAQRLVHLIRNEKVPGSNPVMG